jgi:hypothetical protein
MSWLSQPVGKAHTTPALTVIVTASLAVAPPLSVTVSVSTCVPAGRLIVGVAPVATCTLPDRHT